jgi:hypothetical protein
MATLCHETHGKEHPYSITSSAVMSNEGGISYRFGSL